MSTDPANDDREIREELVAYLDGELDAEGARRMEQRLADEPEVRRVLQELDRTWQCLDSLGEEAVDADFTRTTLEMVALAAEGDAAQARQVGPRRRWRRWLLVGGGWLAATVAGFLAVAAIYPDPNAQLLRDLPRLENFDQYRLAESAEFLRMLVREKLFTEDIEEGSEPSVHHGQAIDSMTWAQKEDLRHHREQFQALDPVHQQRIRHLHEQLAEGPDGEKLRETMNRYCQWLAALPPYRRSDLQEADAARRLKLVKQMVQEQAKAAARRLGPKDQEAAARWMEQYAAAHEAQLLGTLPENRRNQAAKMTPAMRRRFATGLAYQRWLSSNPALFPPASEREMADLRLRLSADARGRLESRPAAEQGRILAAWLRQAARQELALRRGEGTSLIPDFDEQLADFFEFQLGDEERDRLMALPGEEMQQKLREMYLTQTRPAEPPGRHIDRHGRKPAPLPSKKKDKESKPAAKPAGEKGKKAKPVLPAPMPDTVRGA